MVVQIQPWIDERDAEAVRHAVATTFVTEHNQTAIFERTLEALTGARHAIAYANGSCALFAIMRALEIGPGDEVIVPDLTFVASANAVILAGATPIFCDVEPDSMMMDLRCAGALVTPQTKAIMPVHLYGLATDMPPMLRFAEEHSLLVIEDAAQGVGVRRNNRHVGTEGRAGILSFYGNKTVTTGEGGAILTNDDALADACYRLKNHGRIKKSVFVHEEIGFNFSFTELQAALGIAQLSKLDEIIADKRRIRDRYVEGLADVGWLSFPRVPDDTSPVFWFTNVLCDNAEGLANHLTAEKIESRRFFLPLHLQPCYRYLHPSACPHSRRLYERGLSLPSWCGLKDKAIDRICDAIVSFGVPA